MNEQSTLLVVPIDKAASAVGAERRKMCSFRIGVCQRDDVQSSKVASGKSLHCSATWQSGEKANTLTSVLALTKIPVPNYRNASQFFNLFWRFAASRAWLKYCTHSLFGVLDLPTLSPLWGVGGGVVINESGWDCNEHSGCITRAESSLKKKHRKADAVTPLPGKTAHWRGIQSFASETTKKRKRFIACIS